MPNMQRLTWTGIAMHSGNLPGYAGKSRLHPPAIRFLATALQRYREGGTVVIGDGKTPVPRFASNPGLLLAPKDFTPEMLRPLGNNEYDWKPERSPTGPISIVISAADKALYVYRNGNPIGRARWKSADRNRWATMSFPCSKEPPDGPARSCRAAKDANG